jgi:hypothetical protein
MIYYGRREYIITLLKQAMLKISEYIGSLSYNLIISSIGLSSTSFKNDNLVATASYTTEH